MKTLSSKIMYVDYMVMHGFHRNPLSDSQELECPYKFSHISTGTYSRALYLILNTSVDTGLPSVCYTFILSNLHIHEYL